MYEDEKDVPSGDASQQKLIPEKEEKSNGQKIVKKNKPRKKIGILTHAKQILSSDTIHNREFHSRKSAWDSLKGSEIDRAYTFAEKYMKSLEFKTPRERVAFVQSMLERNHYRRIEDIFPGEDVSTVNFAELDKKLKPTNKFYFIYQDTTIVAVQLGTRPIEDGMNLGVAHLDSVRLEGRIVKFDENYNTLRLLLSPVGGVEPRSYFDRYLSMHVHMTVLDKKKKKRHVVDFSIGKNNNGNNEPGIIIPMESYHLADGQISPKIKNLEALIGSRPFPDKRINPHERIKFNIMKMLHRKYGLTEDDLKSAEVTVVPSEKPRFIGLDSSMIGGYGQDNWATAYPLLHAFLRAKKPTYTKVMVLYDKEETLDTGRASIGTEFISRQLTPAIAAVLKKEAYHEAKMLNNTWCWFTDVAQPINNFDPRLHDPLESSYLGSGVILMPQNGDEARMEGYKTSIRFLGAIRTLLEEGKIPYQIAAMGTPDNIAGSNSYKVHSDLGQGIDLGINVYSLHSPIEVADVNSIYFLMKADYLFYSMQSHESLWPTEKK